jgi:predicted metal-binding membrane protein
MSAAARERVDGGLAPAFAAVRVRLVLVTALFTLAGAGWWWTVHRMRGMDAGPWTGLGTLGWFLGVWVVMMAAMMFPSVAPTIALYSRMTRQRSPVSPLLFAGGYLVTWAGAGLVAFAIAGVLGRVPGDVLAWGRAGRWIAGATLVVAAVYELTPFKDVCLGKCRSPLGFLLGSWRDGRRGALRMGMKNGAWCVGCCWALMAAEKTLPWRRVATYGTAALLLVLALMLFVKPAAIPALNVPGPGQMDTMPPMGS